MADIQLRQVRKSFAAIEVIKGVDLSVADGELCVFVGPSGCGKSKLLRMIADYKAYLNRFSGSFAVVDAAPDRYRAGDKVAMVVAGARSDVDVWTFVVTGREAVDVVGQRIDGVLALRREPRKPYDTQVEVWLDPGRHHLPVRLKLSTAGNGGDSMEFVLRP